MKDPTGAISLLCPKTEQKPTEQSKGEENSNKGAGAEAKA